MEINNLALIKRYLKFTEDLDTFYFLQIIGRKKENPELGSNNKVYKCYFIKSIAALESVFEEVKLLCKFHNARAYINLNPKSFKMMAMQSFTEMSNMVLNDNFIKIPSMPATIAGKLRATKGNKRWIIDIDGMSIDEAVSTKWYSEVFTEITKCYPQGEKVLCVIPTISGFHMITTPFNTREFEPFSRKHSIAIHKNNPTILYANITDK